MMPAGIVGGPVKLIKTTSNTTAMDLSNSSWSYKSGLAGEYRSIHLDGDDTRQQWQSLNGTIPVHRPFTWYKATFSAPAGSEPVVADLLGLGKGVAWVNGHNLGRYWPSYVASDMAVRLQRHLQGGRGRGPVPLGVRGARPAVLPRAEVVP